MNDNEERVRRYLRSRADVAVPDDLRWPSAAAKGRPEAAVRVVRSPALAAAVVAAVALGVAVLGAPPAQGPGLESTGPSSSTPLTNGSASPSVSVPDKFPPSVAGMDVVSVAAAVDLLRRGDLDGRAVAVGGYFFQGALRCPVRLQYVGTLEGYCRLVAFTDDPASAALCTYGPNSSSCHGPSGTYLAPFFVRETSGYASWPSVSNREPMPLVLVGHAADARLWQCDADAQETCRLAFVVDRVAWANGQAIPLSVPATWDQTRSQLLTPELTLTDAIATIGSGHEVLALAAFQAGEISKIDPRWNLAGDDIVWLIRSIEGDQSSVNVMRSVTVSLVDDATGDVIRSHDLALDPAYQPARLWTIATVRSYVCCPGGVGARYRVASEDGTLLHESSVSGSAYGSDDGGTTFGPDEPLLFGPGTYTVSAWLASGDPGAIGSSECSTEVTLTELDDLMLEALFPATGGPCTFGPPSPPRLTRF